MDSNDQLQVEQSGFELENLKKFLFDMIVASNNLLRIYKENHIFYAGLLYNRFTVNDFEMKLREQGRYSDFYLSQLEIFNAIQSDSNLIDLTNTFEEIGNLYASSLDLLALSTDNATREAYIKRSKDNFNRARDVVITIKQRLINSLRGMHERRYHSDIQADIKNRISSYFDKLKSYYEFLIKSLLVLNGGGATAILAAINLTNINTAHVNSETFNTIKISLDSFVAGILATLLLLLLTLSGLIYANAPFLKSAGEHAKRVITTQALENKLLETERRKNRLGIALIILLLVPSATFIYGILNGLRLI